MKFVAQPLLLLLPTLAAAATEYDVVIVGSGPGGLVAAEQLSRAAHNLSVLMLEAGDVSLQESGGTDAPPYAVSAGFTKFDIPGEFDNTIYNPENEKYRVDWIPAPYMWLGKLVGGCSSINAALYFRTPDAYVTQATWPFSAEQVAAGFDAIEQFVGSTDVPSSDGKRYVQEAFEIVGGALTSAGYAAKTLNDRDARNSKSKSFGHPPYAIRKGLRDAPAKTFYRLLKTRSNFKLLTNAKVLHVVQAGGKATAVVYESAAKAKTTIALSRRGVVLLAAGALSTPQVLMRSGVGPTKELEALAAAGGFDGVSSDRTAWVPNANVGQRVFDTNVVYASLSHADMKPFLNKKRPQAAVAQYMKDQSGPWATPGPVLIAYESLTVGGRAYDFQTTVLPHGFGDFYETDRAYSVGLFLNNPESRDAISVGTGGTFTVATKGSWYLSTPNDLAALQAYAAKTLAALTAAGSVFLDEPSASAATVAAFVKKSAGSVTHHFGGSCYTSSAATDAQRCADERFKVVGTANIYVSDASLMKEGTVNPYGFVMYIGHQAAANVLQDAFQLRASPAAGGSAGSPSAASPGASTPTTASLASPAGASLLARDLRTACAPWS
ncbi:hypothetical protein PybrP1_012990 [[Pythium] brassicae (nom. inval.)]|nr:hypothetical protein PybrP1_012990 [[Pythium] brassicae (nom. inval.)]